MSTTQLRHLNAPSLEEVERLLESLPRKVEIKSINFAPLRNGGASEWIVHFTVDDWVGLSSVEKINQSKQKASSKKEKTNT